MLNPMIGEKNREHRLALLAAFLDDEEVRVRPEVPHEEFNSAPFSGPCAAFSIPRIAVRDFAALVLACLFKFDDAPNEFWGADRWAALREKVRGRLAAERLPDLASG